MNSTTLKNIELDDEMDDLIILGAALVVRRRNEEKKEKQKPSCRVQPYLQGRFAVDFEDMQSKNHFCYENYSYTNSASNKSNKNSDSTDIIAKAITDLVVIRKQQQETMISNEVQGPVLKYNSMFANLDRMFQQLPQDVVEDLNFRFISQTFDEIKKKNNN